MDFPIILIGVIVVSGLILWHIKRTADKKEETRKEYAEANRLIKTFRFTEKQRKYRNESRKAFIEQEKQKHPAYLSHVGIAQAQKLLRKLQKQDAFKDSTCNTIKFLSTGEIPQGMKLTPKDKALNHLIQNGLATGHNNNTLKLTHNGHLIHKYLNKDATQAEILQSYETSAYAAT